MFVGLMQHMETTRVNVLIFLVRLLTLSELMDIKLMFKLTPSLLPPHLETNIQRHMGWYRTCTAFLVSAVGHPI
ncbi:hypothetical protein DPMN_152585 [Dreissena polymorpha]|uniref:Uncharacterized protein n=1 Tax=Dreissena polymorpha TaxID=45954 RepID=A0A9D4J3Z9_DREPO|nr:hypothetical protein DPMN_152585 [Dreissena polymorpha]